MRERPILFSGSMVRGILEGRKTMTRRVVRPQPAYQGITRFCFEKHPFAPSALTGTPAEGMKLGPEKLVWLAEDWCQNVVGVLGDCPFGLVGDRLWVRETWGRVEPYPTTGEDTDEMPDSDYVLANPTILAYWRKRVIFRADGEADVLWRPSIHMPRWASRILLEVTAVRVERLQDISEEDAKAEGVEKGWFLRDTLDGEERVPTDYRGGFKSVWNELTPQHPWPTNPWVWVIEFRRVTP